MDTVTQWFVETMTYDALNRPLTAQFTTTGENQTWTWDSATGCTNGIGRLCKITDNGGSTTFSYDSHGNLTGETRTEGTVNLKTELPSVFRLPKEQTSQEMEPLNSRGDSESTVA